MNLLKHVFPENNYEAYEGILPPTVFFRLTKQEEIIIGSSCEIKYNDLLIFGSIYISTSFLCFHSLDLKTRFTFPLSTIRQVERTASDTNVFVFDLITVHNQTIHLTINGTRQQSELFCDRLIRQLRLTSHEAGDVTEFLHALASEKLLHSGLSIKNNNENQATSDHGYNSTGLGMQFGFPSKLIDPEFNSERAEKEEIDQWKKYFLENGANFNFVQTPSFIKLIQNGIPDNLRADIWETCSGSLYWRWKSKGFYYNNVHKVLAETCEYSDEIERDLSRSLPSYPAYQSSTGIDALRKVLRFYSGVNSDMGYCQAINIVVAALLVYCTEEQAYFLFSQLSELYIPGYYGKLIHGLLLDLTVFEYVLQQALPHLYQKISEMKMDLKLITINWFFSLFIKDLRLDYAMRILDYFITNGPCVLFQTALALFKINAQGILNAADDASIMKVFQDCFANINSEYLTTEIGSTNSKPISCTFSQLQAIAFEYFDFITNSYILAKRTEFRETVLTSLKLFTKRSHLRGLYQQTNLSNTDLEYLYDAFIDGIGEDHLCHGRILEQKIDYNGFEKLIKKSIPRQIFFKKAIHYQRSERKLFKRLYNWLNKSLDLSVPLNFEKLVIGIETMNMLAEEAPEVFSFQLYDLNEGKELQTDQIVELSESLILICCYEGNHEDDERLTVISDFLRSCFNKHRQNQKEFRISLEQFQYIAANTMLLPILRFFIKKLVKGMLTKENAP
ncbi:GTPase activating protein Gyp2 [Schizosaccharomyces cryophilus OY26]|uniref:GTPase activating protein Gyp2 n=1 Tax=Schizosaccharomyces cryophilus (strain OY26 / ATCC MYA-4695 / CBS 11777 / NBRC 106824 / NRRL Y48691) TaxID=653667 RepID=S9VUD4_SCHCR|nr:GTPase activating protein Gyp2 [Schizosaccharomyces cryophilus OY26]EPY49720.1 GTPase activating protein Gyp2 [Schizosaccharomyces cryophilus OY26]